MGFDPTPTFLGVTNDRQLMFAAHAQKAASKLAKGSQVMMALAGSDWGWSRDLLSRVYNACILSKANYAVGLTCLRRPSFAASGP